MMGIGQSAARRAEGYYRQQAAMLGTPLDQQWGNPATPWGLDGKLAEELLAGPGGNMYQLDAEWAFLTGAAPVGWKTRREMEERAARLRKPIDVPDWAPLTPAQWLFLAVVVALMGLGYACFTWGL
jgi:hypothetical protein